LTGRDNRTRRTTDAQALVEFALVLPVLMLVLMSIVQLGFMFAGQIGLTNAVREAARYGSLSPTQNTTNATANGASVTAYLTGTVLPKDVPGYAAANVRSTSVTYCQYANPGGSSYSVRITVSVRYAHPLFIPLVGLILDPFDGASDGGLAVTSTESFRVENMPLNASEVSTLTSC
jgi:Flp pilus assembly protein TadG